MSNVLLRKALDLFNNIVQQNNRFSIGEIIIAVVLLAFVEEHKREIRDMIDELKQKN